MFIFILVLTPFLFSSVVENPEKPVKGDWDLKLTKEWAVDRAGEEVLAVPSQLRISEDGTLYFHDSKNEKSYIFESSGNFKKSFGEKGEGPGEVKRHLTLNLINDLVIVGDQDRLHYFTKDGKYIKSVPNMVFTRHPQFFLNEDEFFYAPQSVVGLPNNKGNISVYNLKTKTERVIKEFSVFEGGVVYDKDAGALFIIVEGLTPAMILGFENNKLYYGMNSRYVINVVDLNGKPLNSFSLSREKIKLSQQKKREHFKDLSSRMSGENLEKLIRSLPDELGYFHRIQPINGFIYVFTAGFGFHRESQQIDVFSPEGKYLYRSIISFGKNFSIMRTDLEITKNHLYVVLEDDMGEATVAKYKITLPKL
jgi:hypothetical protein